MEALHPEPISQTQNKQTVSQNCVLKLIVLPPSLPRPATATRSCDSVMGMSTGASWAALVLAVCVLCGQGKKTYRTREANLQGEVEDNLHVGRSLNLLPRYGFLTLSVKVS